jgi:hypothetical protein
VKLEKVVRRCRDGFNRNRPPAGAWLLFVARMALSFDAATGADADTARIEIERAADAASAQLRRI